MVPAVLYALAKLYRAIAIVHALVWHGSGRGSAHDAEGVGLLGAGAPRRPRSGRGRRLDPPARPARRDQRARSSTSSLVGGAWLVVSMQLPHRDVRWPALVPGALLVGAGLLFVNVFNVYVTTRLVEDRANTYGALGIAAALLFSLVLVGRLIVVSAELNAALDDRRASGK